MESEPTPRIMQGGFCDLNPLSMIGSFILGGNTGHQGELKNGAMGLE